MDGGRGVKRITIKEIAKMAGVSVTSVSFVLNGKPGVSEETRARVQRIIDESGFRPNLTSKKLLLNKSFNICLLANPFSSPFEDLFYFEITRGILNRSRRFGYSLTIDEPVQGGTELPDPVRRGDSDGIIFMQDIPGVLAERAEASGLPFVVVDSHAMDPRVTSVNADYCGAARDAARCLIRHGHRDIALIASSVVPEFRAQTLAGFAKAMEEAGLPIDPAFTGIAVTGEESAYQAARRLLTAGKRPTAILCTVDIFAIGAMRCARDLGLIVPDDVSFIGIDDILLSRYTEPRLSTVGIDKERMGELAMDMLLQKLRGESPESALLPMQLIERDSVRTL